MSHHGEYKVYYYQNSRTKQIPVKVNKNLIEYEPR